MENIMRNPICSADTYKYGHWLMDPTGVTEKSGYVEPRGGKAREIVNFGLQAFLKTYLLTPYTMDMVEEAKDILDMHVGPNYFNYEGFKKLVAKYGGRPPIEIQAAPEGMPLAPGNIQVQVRSLDPEFTWFATWIETQLLRGIWYPSTVATVSRETKKIIFAGLKQTADKPEEAIKFKLHDFGGRGTSSGESAMLGGMGHLVNFLGTDTVEALWGARKFYGEKCAGFSVPASEHSIATTWGPDREVEYVRHMIRTFDREGALFSIVGDSYDIFAFVREVILGELLGEVKNLKGKLVIRPDSGDPTELPIEVIKLVMSKMGNTVSRLGYRRLPAQLGVIQGDGNTPERIGITVNRLIEEGLDVDNLVWGMGGGLLQQVSRDDHKYAMKANEVVEDGVRKGIAKDPKTDAGKVSKSGRQALTMSCGIGSCALRSIPERDLRPGQENLLEVVYKSGELVKETTFAEVRKRAEIR